MLSEGSWNAGPGVLRLPDGRRIRARGLRRPLPAGGEEPACGLYLLGSPPAEMPWTTRWIRWGDFRLPRDGAAAVAALVELHARAEHERVEVACGGGIGRTGTALAVLARLSGVPAEGAVAWVRAHHHRRAVETRAQRRWAERVELPLGR